MKESVNLIYGDGKRKKIRRGKWRRRVVGFEGGEEKDGVTEERENGRAMEGVGSEFFKHENWKEMRMKGMNNDEIKIKVIL